MTTETRKIQAKVDGKKSVEKSSEVFREKKEKKLAYKREGWKYKNVDHD